MIENLTLKSILNIALILTTLFVGIILHKIGRPYNSGVFAIHKLTTVAFIVLTIKMITAFGNNHELGIFPLILIVLTTISVIGLLVSGGAMSLDKSHAFMLTIHRVSTVVFLFSISGIFFTIYQIKP